MRLNAMLIAMIESGIRLLPFIRSGNTKLRWK
jgi:hypothetical protein